MIVFVIFIFLGFLSWKLAGLPYNSEERYFDASTSIAYDQDTVLAYFILAICFFAKGVTVFFFSKNKKSKG